jgi:hypothetical protein
MGIRRFSILLLLSILLASCFVVQVHATSTWSIQTVDKNAASGGGAIALDSNNNPHIAYYAYENGSYRNPGYLMYASWNGSGWNIQTVDSNSATGSGPIVTDSKGSPHICYSRPHPGQIWHTAYLMYATPSPTTLEPALWIILLLFAVAAVATFVYLKKKRSHKRLT